LVRVGVEVRVGVKVRVWVGDRLGLDWVLS